MEANQQKLEKQVESTKNELTKQLTDKDKKIQELQKDIYINKPKAEPEKPKVETKKKEKKPNNFSRNPLNRVVGTAASVVGGVGTFIHRRNAKVEEIGAEPSQLVKKQFWKDLGHNIKKAPKQIWKTMTGGFRKKAEPSEMVNTQKSHTPSRSRKATKGQPMWKRLPKAARWLARKPVKIAHRLEQTAENVMGDAFSVVKDTKISGNPKKWNFWRPSTWNLKQKFTRTRRSWHLLTHWDGKTTEGKVVNIKNSSGDQKKAA